MFYPKNAKGWRNWLAKNHEKAKGVWLVYYKKSTQVPTVAYTDAVDEALCFGWIDSTRRSLDEQRSIQFFCKRKTKSVWSKINKAKVERLTEAGLMQERGLQSVEIAKQNGSWAILDEVEELIVPKDLAKAFKKSKGAKNYFLSLSKSSRKGILQWLVMAKRVETREKRITEIVGLAEEGKKPKGV